MDALYKGLVLNLAMGDGGGQSISHLRGPKGRQFIINRKPSPQWMEQCDNHDSTWDISSLGVLL